MMDMLNILSLVEIIAFIVLCIILAPFFKPLFWAVLIGAVLFPLKRILTSMLKEWLNLVEKNDSDIFLAFGLAPLRIIKNIGAFLKDSIKKEYKLILSGQILLVLPNLLSYMPKQIISVFQLILYTSNLAFTTITSLMKIPLIVTLLLFYFTSVYLFWNSTNSHYFAAGGQSLWVIIFSYFCSFFGTLQIPVFVLLVFILLIAILNIRGYNEKDNLYQSIGKLLDVNLFKQSIDAIYTSDKKDSESLNNAASSAIEMETHGNVYFKLLYCCCIITILYRNTWILFILAVSMVIYLINIFSISAGLSEKVHKIILKLQEWALQHHSAVLPLWLPGILMLNFKIQLLLRDWFKSSIHFLSSIFMIVLMIFSVIFIGTFVSINIYSETIDIAYLGQELINKTITESPEMMDILPGNIQNSIDDAIDNAHHFGRRKIEIYLDNLLLDSEPNGATKLKTQILYFWDRLIQYWMNRDNSDTVGPRISRDAIKSTFDEIVDNPELVLAAQEGLLGWAKSNTNTIMEIIESLWHIIRTNISTLATFAGQILSVVFSGGQVFVEFILDVIVFFTALFYFLNMSKEKYFPLQILRHFFASSGSQVVDVLENSISSVLNAMLKLAVFQGLFTWLVHTIFEAKIIFLPSVFAAILSIAPLLGSYWCALPAFFELWLFQDRFYAAVTLLLLHFFVPSYVEQVIRLQMEGIGHPYMIGLAIAGGMYWFNWQGAIFGPLILCFFIGIYEATSLLKVK